MEHAPRDLHFSECLKSKCQVTRVMFFILCQLTQSALKPSLVLFSVRLKHFIGDLRAHTLNGDTALASLFKTQVFFSSLKILWEGFLDPVCQWRTAIDFGCKEPCWQVKGTVLVFEVELYEGCIQSYCVTYRCWLTQPRFGEAVGVLV